MQHLLAILHLSARRQVKVAQVRPFRLSSDPARARCLQYQADMEAPATAQEKVVQKLMFHLERLVMGGESSRGQATSLLFVVNPAHRQNRHEFPS
jgi:hypothetical protein